MYRQPARLGRLRRGARPGDRGNVGDGRADDLLALLDAALGDADLDARPGRGARRLVRRVHDHLAGLARTATGSGPAICERAVNAIDSFTGSSRHRLVLRRRSYVGADRDAFSAQSPLTYADKIDIPMLIIHSEQDWRCPVEQAQRLFVALKRAAWTPSCCCSRARGTSCRRSGLPRHRVARFDAILDWWSRHFA